MFGLTIQRSPNRPLQKAGWWELISTTRRPFLRSYVMWRDGLPERGVMCPGARDYVTRLKFEPVCRARITYY